jgi:hypothetical protein
MSRNQTVSRPISASFLVKKKWPTLVSPRSMSSITKTFAATCNWLSLFTAVEVVVAVAAVAALGVAAGAAAAVVAAAAAYVGDGAASADLPRNLRPQTAFHIAGH